jgi:hypothetical protein
VRDHIRLLEGALRIGDDTAAIVLVRRGALDDLVEPLLRNRQPLRGPDLRFGCGGKGAQEVSQVLFVVGGGHAITFSHDAAEVEFLPSSSTRSLTRQREIRLAIVPVGTSSASLIVR